MHIITRIVRKSLFEPLSWNKVFKIALWRPIVIRIKTIIFGAYSVHYYPSELKSVVKNIGVVESISLPDYPLIWPFLNSFERTKNSKAQISLAGKISDLDDIRSFWESQIDKSADPEFLSAVHRFHWLLQMVSQNCDEKLLEEMNSMIIYWIETHQQPVRSKLEWHPYNVSERITNLIIYIQILRTNKLKIDHLNTLMFSIRQQIYYLVKNLEYPASGVVNNHILNNARALYFAGVFLESGELMSISKFLFRRHLASMVDNFGFLLEGSSHYQLLLTRSLIEIEQLASFIKDHDYFFDINLVSKKMLESSQFLVVGNHELPLIGDVSPDLPAHWFWPLETAKKAGWQRIWRTCLPDLTNNQVNQRGDWYRLSNHSQTLITHGHKHERNYPIGHGHNDFGSFTLYMDGAPLVIDIGRYSYQQNEEIGPDSIDNRHNMVYLEDTPILSPSIGIQSLLEDVEQQFFSVELSKDNDTLTFKAGNRRTKVCWKRTIFLGDEGTVQIEDKIIGAKKIKGYFNLGKEVDLSTIEKKEIICRLKNNEYRIITTGVQSFEIEDCLVYESYGEKVGAKRMKWFSSSESGLHSISFVIGAKKG